MKYSKLYSQQFVPLKRLQKARVLNFIRLERFAMDKLYNLLDPLMSQWRKWIIMKRLPDLPLGVHEERFPLFRTHQLNKNENQMIFFSGKKPPTNNFRLSPLLSLIGLGLEAKKSNLNRGKCKCFYWERVEKLAWKWILIMNLKSLLYISFLSLFSLLNSPSLSLSPSLYCLSLSLFVPHSPFPDRQAVACIINILWS